MKYTKEQLIGFAKQYFENKSIDKIFATSDNNFFFSEHSSYARSHAKTNELELYVITYNDVFPKIEEQPKEVEKIEEVKQEIKEELTEEVKPEEKKPVKKTRKTKK